MLINEVLSSVKWSSAQPHLRASVALFQRHVGYFSFCYVSSLTIRIKRGVLYSYFPCYRFANLKGVLDISQKFIEGHVGKNLF